MFDFTRTSAIVDALRYRGRRQRELFSRARRVRDEVFAGSVEARSVIEYSNVCRQECRFCGMHGSSAVTRYCMDTPGFLARFDRLYAKGRRVIMVQSGEFGPGVMFERLFGALKQARGKYRDCTIMCSFGNLETEQYERLRAIGIERYLLKFETSDPRLYREIKPSDSLRNRLAHIAALTRLGFQVSSGNITGLPGQTIESLADDIALLRKLDIPMCSTSVFIPNDRSQFAGAPPGDIDTALNFTAILRIACPRAIIPATSSLELVAPGGQMAGLMAGCNAVTLHDGTPRVQERKYVIYREKRFKPKDALFAAVARAGLRVSPRSILREKIPDSVYHRMILRHCGKRKTAVYADGRRYSYEDIGALTDRACSFLLKQGITRGQVVILAVYDSVDFILSMFACIRLGVIVAPVDPRSGADEWRTYLSVAKPDRVLCSGGAFKAARDPRFIKISDDDSSGYFMGLLERQAACRVNSAEDRHNPGLILFSSGTTGRSKGIVHVYEDMLSDAFPRGVLGVRGSDIMFSFSGMFFGFGLSNSCFFPFLAGAGVIVSRTVPNAFSFTEISKLSPTILFAVPGIYELFTQHALEMKGAFRSVRMCVSSGEKLSVDVLRRWRRSFGIRMVESYGSTEMHHPFIANNPASRRPGSCGTVVKGFAVRFTPEGRLVYTGPTLARGYYNEPGLTRERFVDGWFFSDDTGYLKNGYVYVTGRMNLVFKRSGKWVSIPDIENKLKKCRIVKDVMVRFGPGGLDYSVCCRGKAGGQVAEAAIREFCKHHLRMHEFPRHIRLVDRIPRTRSGKIIRYRAKAAV
jgi:biotin synthase